ncbi:PstS family phosphate ABC transporter substrate-binding protein [Shewanella sp. SG44-6]|uniref:PstS family phosphate ABC transporter substrate-binding protein n=1 Tax=Shewanella sp. SG44-6 TaxID=2760959 RepID=UPI0016029D24|nr:PstS family phosphate ABC transporter substrate-binding protein [Shewanella sp. SG44-6]MBB1391842.1 PstS family phosphate ABC transporter substrate-binding protein [Shewanella sp. SG44-6]
MKIKIRNVILGTAVMLALPQAMARDLVKVDGSSTVFPATEAVAEEFQQAEKGKTMVTVGISGTGGGFKKFCRGETDISNASRPIKDSEKKLCAENNIEYIELPGMLDALSIVINPKNDWVDYLTVDELKKMYEPDAQGKITNWNQIRSTFPDRPLKLFGAGTDSGTYDYFVEAVVGGKSTRGDYTATEDDNVMVQGVASDVNAVAFFGLAYYEENHDKLKAVPISWKGEKAVSPSSENARNASYQPLSRPLFIYVNKKSTEKAHVNRFVEFYMNKEHASKLIAEVGYVPLPEKAYDMALEKYKNKVTGSVFHGSEVGVGIEELLKRTPVH